MEIIKIFQDLSLLEGNLRICCWN